MTDMAAVREAVDRQFSNVREVDAKVIRGEKLHGNKCYAIAYVDLADDIVARASHLREFQERVLGDDFFEAPEQLRWNNYLYLVAGPNSLENAGFQDAKARIEADKDFARKRVVSENELVELLGDSMLFDAEHATPSEDVVGAWATQLSAGGLDSLIDKPTPRTEVVERIGKRNATRATATTQAKPLSALDQEFSQAHLRSLRVERFRPVHDGNTYTFGAVTLIVGPNGSGKTSLLEAIEYLYCGHNRRPTMTGSLRVKGVCAALANDKVFEIASTTDIARIKARCLAWYRRSEHQAKAILDGFTRYNFLDTDAAFRLSTELEPGDISKDLSRLLVGAEASMLWEYLGKICADLDTAWRRTSERLAHERERAVLLGAEVRILTAAPSQAGSLSITYRSALKAVGWLGTAGPTGPVTASERQPLEEVARWLADLLTLRASGAETKGGIRARIIEIERTIDLARPIEAKRDELERQINVGLSNAANIDTEIARLNSWLQYCSADFHAALEARQVAREASEAARNRLGPFLSVSAPATSEDLAAISISDAESAAQSLASSSTVSIASLEAAEKSFGLLEAAHAQASQQLKEAAIILLQQGHSARECPVCGTDHTPEALLAKIVGITSRATSSEPLKRLQESIGKARGDLAAAQQRLAVLSTIRQIATRLGLSSSHSIGEVTLRFQDAKLESQRADAELISRLAHIESLNKTGLSEGAFSTLRADVRPLFHDDVIIDQAGFVTTLRDTKSFARQALEAKLAKLRADRDEATDQVHSTVRTLESADWPLVATQSIGFHELLEMHAKILSMHALAVKVATRVALPDDRKFGDVRQALTGVIASYDQAFHATTSEASASQTLMEKEATLSQSRARVSALSNTTNNQRSALDVLEGLIRDSSLEGATRDALEAIRLQINDVFSRIHSPREYEYSETGEQLLQTRDGHSPRTLDEVSTGQRAAFALSIFLALNLTAQSAPPLVLIDDPIAHIDDLNALSFLDYLRDLAIHSKKQIFFATADSRIATLFEKKFSFLGDVEFKKIGLVRRTET